MCSFVCLFCSICHFAVASTESVVVHTHVVLSAFFRCYLFALFLLTMSLLALACYCNFFPRDVANSTFVMTLTGVCRYGLYDYCSVFAFDQLICL